MRVLSADDVAELLSLSDLLPEIERAFLKQGRGEVERPERPHFPVGVEPDDDAAGDTTGATASDAAGTALTMPASIHGDRTYATKLASVHPDNPERGLPTVHAQLLVTESRTGVPLALFAAEAITNARTGCIGGLAARDLAVGDGPVSLAVLGAGAQARWQTRAIRETRGIDSLRVYSPNSRESFAAARRADGIDAAAVETAAEAVHDADVVVTATTSSEPVFPGDALAADALVIAVGAYTPEMRELDATTMARADRVIADVPEEVAEIGDIVGNDVSPDRLEPLSDTFERRSGSSESGRRPADGEGVIVVESVGSAVLDAAAGEYLYRRVDNETAGTEVSL